jgi:hypothetical protein
VDSVAEKALISLQRLFPHLQLRRTSISSSSVNLLGSSQFQRYGANNYPAKNERIRRQKSHNLYRVVAIPRASASLASYAYTSFANG